MATIGDPRLLGEKLAELKFALAKSNRDDVVRTIEDAMLAGSTSLEIHYRLMGVLRQIRPTLASDENDFALIDDMIGSIERIVYRNS